MDKPLPLFLLACALLLPAPGARAGEASLRFEEGVARRPGTGVELYRESHWIRRDGERPLERVVLYRCPDGAVFGRKRVDYRASVVAPGFEFEDARSGYQEGLRRAGGGMEVFFRTNGKAVEQRASVRSAQLIADAGFDEFIRRQWQPLLAGKSVPLQFAIPSRLRSMGFAVSRIGEALVGQEKAWVFRLKLSGLLGLVAPSIDVSYGQASRRLLRFEGLGNLRDDAGDTPLVARIDFAAPARLATEVQWQAAIQAPLSACRIGR